MTDQDKLPETAQEIEAAVEEALSPAAEADKVANAVPDNKRPYSHKDLMKGLGQRILDRRWDEWAKEVVRAREAYLKAVANHTNTGWVSREDLNPLLAFEKKIMYDHWPRVRSRALNEFLDRYRQLIVEFPELQQGAYEDGVHDGQNT